MIYHIQVIILLIYLIRKINYSIKNYQHPISSGQIKLFQNIRQYKIKIKMCVII